MSWNLGITPASNGGDRGHLPQFVEAVTESTIEHSQLSIGFLQTFIRHLKDNPY